MSLHRLNMGVARFYCWALFMSHGAVVDDWFFALSLVTDGGRKLVPIGQHFTAQDKFVLFEAAKNSLWEGKKKYYSSLGLCSANVDLA